MEAFVYTLIHSFNSLRNSNSIPYNSALFELVYVNNKLMFEKRLFTLSLDQLKTILEDIRTTISLNSNKNNFMVLSQTLLKGIETLWTEFNGVKKGTKFI